MVQYKQNCENFAPFRRFYEVLSTLVRGERDSELIDLADAFDVRRASTPRRDGLMERSLSKGDDGTDDPAGRVLRFANASLADSKANCPDARLGDITGSSLT